MAVKTFNWMTEREMDTTITYRVIETKFGDGYTQTATEGINTKDQQYAIRVNAKSKVASEIMDFFDEHQGYKAFLWKPPLGKLALYRCVDPTPKAQGGDLWLITGTFVKSYASIG